MSSTHYNSPTHSISLVFPYQCLKYIKNKYTISFKQRRNINVSSKKQLASTQDYLNKN